MIDTPLIEKNAEFIESALTNKTKISEYLYTIKDILPNETLIKLREIIDTSEDWECQETAGGYEYNPLRQKLGFKMDTVIEEVSTAMNNLNYVMEDIVGIDMDFLGVTVWRDLSGYNIDWHTDNSILTATLQIYLFGEDCPGTTFKTDNGEFTCSFKSNTGYVARQHTKDRPMHKIEKTVSSERCSLFFMWGLPGTKIK